MVVGGAVTSDKMLAQNRPLAVRFLRAVIKGVRYVNANEDATIAILMHRFPNMTREHYEASYARVNDTFSTDGTVSDALSQQAIDENAEVLGLGPDGRKTIAEVADFSVAHEANKSLDAEGWKPLP